MFGKDGMEKLYQQNPFYNGSKSFTLYNPGTLWIIRCDLITIVVDGKKTCVKLFFNLIFNNFLISGNNFKKNCDTNLSNN